MLHRDQTRQGQTTGNDRPATRRRENAVWVSLVALVTTVLLVFTATPALVAQSLSDTDRAMSVFQSVLEFIEQNYVEEVDADALLEGALRGMFESLDDPYSVYYDDEEMRGLNDMTAGEFGGVGMTITKQQGAGEEDAGENEPVYVRVVAPIEDTPAFREGIRPGDLIVAIRDQEADEFTSTLELTLDEAVNMIRGTPGSVVTLRIRRGTRAEFEVDIERAIIEVPTVKYAMIGDDIGFLRITSFNPRTIERVEESIAFFEQNDYESLIIDVRSNPGGLLGVVTDIVDMFFERGTIVGTAGRAPGENERRTATPGVIVEEDVPVVVLIDKGSASASEILAGALQDRNRAYLIGETTFGKGSVQQVRRIGDGGFRLTMARYYLPSGRFIDQVGVDPDKVVEPPELTDEQAEDYTELVSGEVVVEFVREHPDPDESELVRLEEQIRAQGLDIPSRWIRVAVRDEVNRQNNEQPAYDLEYDEALQEAVRMLRAGEISAR